MYLYGGMVRFKFRQLEGGYPSVAGILNASIIIIIIISRASINVLAFCESEKPMNISGVRGKGRGVSAKDGDQRTSAFVSGRLLCAYVYAVN